jgi:hypothetical protein
MASVGWLVVEDVVCSGAIDDGRLEPVFGEEGVPVAEGCSGELELGVML